MNCSENNDTCSSESAQYATVSVPINLKPYGNVGNVKTECFGQPTVTFAPRQGVNGSCGCEIVITQTICIRIPIEYGTVAQIGSTCFNCKKNP
ncbi:MAG: hypothetical protein RR107_06815 [Clostridia bacterium]